MPLHKSNQLFTRSVFSLLFLASVNPGLAHAQIVPDGTLPTVVQQLQNMRKITGGERVGNISAGDILFKDGSSITSSTTGEGNGGTIKIEANLINIAQSGKTTRSNISASTFSTGDNSGNAGDVIIDTKSLQIRDGGSVSSSSFAEGNSGNIRINASESLEISEINQNITSDNPQSTIRTATQAASPVIQRILGLPASPSGNAGSLTINTPVLNVTQEGVITVENQGTGSAGTLTINAKGLFKNNFIV